jgi:aryl-alcohol dehydrogenase-like predicted oxidoreductase
MGENPNRRGGSRKWIVREVESSLGRLDTDYIDLYQMHRPDYETDLGETLSALSDLDRAGKIRAFDEIVPPGTDLDPRDNYYATPPAIADARLRRS